MSNILGFAAARKTSRGELLATWLSGGAIHIYDGTRPETADTAVGSQVNLVTFTLPDPAGTVTSGVFTGAAITAVMVDYAGTATWARVVDDSDGVIFDCDVGTSNALITLDNVSLVEGGYCSVTSFTLIER